MRKLNLKLLSTASAIAMVVAATAPFAQTTGSTIIDPALLPESLWFNAVAWNELDLEGALSSAINGAVQVAAIYAVQVGSANAPATIVAGQQPVTVNQSYWTSISDASYDTSGNFDPENAGLLFVSENSMSANTTFFDATITGQAVGATFDDETALDYTGFDQTAYVTFQTASYFVEDQDPETEHDETVFDIAQFVDGANAGFDNNGEGNDRFTAYEFALISRNEIDASASQQGTAVIDGLSFDQNPDTLVGGSIEDTIAGSQLAIVSMNTSGFGADDGETVLINLGGQDLIDLNGSSNDYLYGGQGFDVMGVSGGSNYWDVQENNDSVEGYVDYEQFALEASNWAGAYAPHPLTANDPAVRNLDQSAFVNTNTITVGSVGMNDSLTGADSGYYGDADFTIMATIDTLVDGTDSEEYSLGQFANFNGNQNNLATLVGQLEGMNNSEDLGADDAYQTGEANWMSEVTVRNTVIATTILDDYLYAAGGQDVAGVDVGGLEDGLADLPSRYTEGYGDVDLTNIEQVASLGVNSITNIGQGDLKLVSGVLIDAEDPTVGFSDPISFTQSVSDFLYANTYVQANSLFDNNQGSGSIPYLGSDEYSPPGLINFATASTIVGDVGMNGVHQTASFAFNSIRSVGNILGWTNLESDNPNVYDATLASPETGAGIVQFADTTFYVTDNGNEDGLQSIIGTTTDGNIDAVDLSQTAIINANSISSNGSIYADIAQAAQGAWFIEEPNDLELYARYEDEAGDWVTNGDITGNGLSQAAIYTANTITTAELTVLDLTTEEDLTDTIAPLDQSNDLIAAFVIQDASELQFTGYGGYGDGYWGGSENELDLFGDSVNVYNIDQAFQITINKIDVAGSILIGAVGDSVEDSVLVQTGLPYSGFGSDDPELAIHNQIDAANTDTFSEDDSRGDVILGANGVDNMGVQAAYLNVNSIAAGELISGNVLQVIDASGYVAYNEIGATAHFGDVSLTNFTQSAAVNLNTVTAGAYLDANIAQEIQNDLTVVVDNIASAITDHGSAAMSGMTQQAIIRINTIGG